MGDTYINWVENPKDSGTTIDWHILLIISGLLIASVITFYIVIKSVSTLNDSKKEENSWPWAELIKVVTKYLNTKSSN